MLRRLLLLLAIAPLAACATVPLGSIVPLARIDVMTTDLSMLRAALRLPAGLRPQPSGVQMDVTLTAADQPTKVVAFVLVETREPNELAGLPGGGDPAYIYRLAPDDIARFDALRQDMAAQQAAHRQGSLAIGIATREFCTTAPLPAGPVLTSSYLLTSENAGFVTLLEGFDLRGDPKLAGAFDALAPC